MASLRHRRGIAEAAAEDYYDDDDDVHDDCSGTAPDTDTATEQEEEEEEGEGEEDHRLHLGIHSMTAKGIQHLCSELLEIKKASEQDFRANVYVSYLSFIRMLQEAGDLDKDVHRLKRQVIAHRRLIQQLSANCGLYSSSSSSILLAGSGSKDEEAGVPLPAAPGDDHGDEELELGVLLSEHRMEEALELQERQAQALQRTACSEAMIASLSARRKARVADRLASVAGNPRTPRPELLKALSGLCKLGDAERANHLLFNWYRASVVRGVEELRASHSHSQAAAQAPSSGSNYIKDLARMVFSSIVHASRSFLALHGHPSPYTPQLLRWAREEMEDFSVAFSEYVESISQQVGQSLALALEAAECAVSYSSLLRPLGIEQDVAGLIAPCIREVLAMYVRHLKEVVRLLVASDVSWVLGRFRLAAVNKEAAQQHRYCLLTTSGRKFVTLIQEVVDDVACPLLNLGDDSAAVQLVAELFREYMHSILELIIPSKQGDEQYMWQLSVLINCTALVSLFPSIASGFSASAAAEREVGSLIKEAAGQVWNCFCQQFVRDTMSLSASASESESASGQAQGEGTMMMPSLAFQVVFLRVRRLKDAYGAILSGEDGTMKKLLQELMEAIISWLSSNPPESWIVHGAQAQLDVHFLLEIAQLGGLDITASALDLLLRKAQAEEVEDGSSGVIRGDEEGCGWAADAAKHAVQVLLQNISPHAAEDNFGDVAAVDDAAEEFEFELGSEFDDMASGNSAAVQVEAPDASDEFISIEEEDEEKLMGSSDQAAAPQHSDNDDSSSGENGRRQQQAALAAENKGSSNSNSNAPGRSRKKREAVSRSSRPRWQ
ncbi:hypothetical protein BAE44_0003934 [Dichanthelium oligosanthes]|uniref:Exocyst complex component EXO84C n=1 Tax=Dichanthelium oligosanthes TaxID=888268 RepID=A0A1E5WC88_9POAL|nr:hypothetical protein BAE44_0003934 [Dichanthelium oligosanthes]